MADEEWTSEDTRSWLEDAFEWFKTEWAKDDNIDKNWSDLKASLLTHLDITEDDAVAKELSSKVDSMEDDDSYALFTSEDNESELTALVDSLVKAWEDDQDLGLSALFEEGESQAEGQADDNQGADDQAADDDVPAEDEIDRSKPYWNGEQWLRYDEASDSWLQTEAPEGEAAEQALAEPQQAAEGVVSTIGTQAMEQAMSNPVFASLSPEQRTALLSEVLADQLSNA